VSGCCGWVTALSRNSGGAAVLVVTVQGRYISILQCSLSIPPSYLDARTSVCHASLVRCAGRRACISWVVPAVHVGGRMALC
jgi:hypothetical protein